MGQQRGTTGPRLTHAGKGQKEKSAIPSRSRSEQSVDGVQEILGSRAGSRALRSQGQHQGDEVAPQPQALRQLLQSVSPVSPRVQAKPFFGGVSQAWGGGATSGVVIQPKLTVGAAGDKYEQEADRVASEVVDRINAPSHKPAVAQPYVQRMGESEEELQLMRSLEAIQHLGEVEEGKKRKTIEETSRQLGKEDDELRNQEMVQRVGSEGGSVSEEMEGSINRARGGGQPLDSGLKRSMGTAMGADFRGVRVHTDTQSDQLNQSIQAKAFTTGNDVFFRQGAYDPGSRWGQELIAHELTHVVQQMGGDVKRPQLPTAPANGGYGIETCPVRNGKRGRGATVTEPPGEQVRTRLSKAKQPSAAGGLPRRTCPKCGNEKEVQRRKNEAERVRGDATGPKRSGGETVQRKCGDGSIAKHKKTFGKAEYGPLHDGAGTCADVLLWKPQPARGGRPTVKPPWWPTQSLKGVMVQGHLWNNKLGGPGNKMDNMTPITVSANGQHHAKVESDVKAAYDNGIYIHYVVQADYKQKPKLHEMSPYGSVQNILRPDVKKGRYAQKISAEYTLYDKKWKDSGGDRWEIGNEDSRIT